MKKILVDRDEVLKIIGKTYVDLYYNKETVTSEEFAVLDFAKEVTNRVGALDFQKIKGIDLGKGGWKSFASR